MKILLINKFYYLRGGTERHVFALADLLKRSGHQVVPFAMQDEKNQPTPYRRYFSRPVGLETFNPKNIVKLFYNREAAQKLKALIRAERPDLAHLHNVSHQLSSSVIRVLKKRNLPVIQTLHDYKLICPNYRLFSRGRICLDCRGHKYYRCALRRCLKKSFLKSSLAALEAYYCRLSRVYEKIDLFIAPSRFMKETCAAFGQAPDKIKVFNHFLYRRPAVKSAAVAEPYLLYFGRLSDEKGVETLVRAMAETEENVKLKIIGAGPEFGRLNRLIEELKLGGRITLLGPKYGEELDQYLAGSLAVVAPSLWPENFPYAVLESLAAGRPVLASAVGGLKEMIRHGENGFLFEPGNPAGLARAIGGLMAADQEKLSRAAAASAKKYDERSYAEELIEIYRQLIERRRGGHDYKSFVKVVVFAALLFLCPPTVLAADAKFNFPKVANYYLQPIVPKQHVDDLAKFDLVVLDAEAPKITPGLLGDIKALNPDGRLFAYMPSQSVNLQGIGQWSKFRAENYQAADAGDWWLRDAAGNVLSFNSTWPTIKMIDVNSGWKNHLPDFLNRQVLSNGQWDGIFLDMVSFDLDWLNNGNVLIAGRNIDGRTDRAALNRYWSVGMNQLIAAANQAIGSRDLLINPNVAGSSAAGPDGEMMENFPAGWLGANGWSKLMSLYLKNNKDIYTYIINANANNRAQPDNYRNMRFGLTSTLLGDGYFSYDQGDQNHAQVWWYDEYDVNLGRSESRAYNLLDPANSAVKAGLWRRDFENGIVITNSTAVEQTYVFNKEEFEKIKGRQDAAVNNGQKINWFKLAPNDGFIALKILKEIENNAYLNGGFVRIFNAAGLQVRNGLFAYRASFPGGAKILSSDLEGDGRKEILANGAGKISGWGDGKLIFSFSPFMATKPEVNFAVAKFSRDGGQRQIIAGAGAGGGPQIRLFDNRGRLISGGFFAFDKNFRGGVNVAAGDINGDGRDEIIAGAGAGGGPHVRVFDDKGRLLGQFFAFDKNFRGGVNVAAGDINGDGRDEIIAGAGAGGGPHVRIFDLAGRLISQFFAADKSSRQGAYASAYDIDNDKIDEILVNVNIF